MIRMRHLMVLAAAALAACASAPIHYYTLVPAPDDSQVSNAMHPARFQFELLPVSIPAQNDVPQLVVRQGGQSVALLDDQRWAAPLADEVRGALSVDLARRLNAQDVSNGGADSNKPRVRIKVDLSRFDSSPGHYALIDAVWSVRSLSSQAAMTCHSRIDERVGEGYETLVAGHQQALSALAEQIARVAPVVAAGAAAKCP